MKKTVVKIEQDPNDIIERVVLAKSIIELSRWVQKLMASGLNEKAVVCLVHETSGVGKPDIRAVIASLKTLEADFIRKQEASCQK